MLLSLRHNFRRAFRNKISPIIMKKSEKSTKIGCTTLSNTPAKFEDLPSPIKSENDKKEYKVIRLENGLIACLISDVDRLNENAEFDEEFISSEESDDQETDEDEDECADTDGCESVCSRPGRYQKMAAAALCVAVGSYSDPINIPGMAHFLEHMVFMGSEKYPEENDFDSFISNKGGSNNASTDVETTNFYFDCLDKDLYVALDKFAQFFINPLMKRESMTREREAIDSEFQMASPSDNYRKEQLLCNLAKKDSPVNKFAWGNLVTLRDNISDDKLYECLHEFRKRHYSANRMTLVIQARLSLDQLQEYVVHLFSDIPNNNLGPLDYKSKNKDVFDTPEFRRMYFIQPTKDVCQVELVWALPSLLHKYKSKPHQYLSWLTGDEGEGSLLSYLRKKVWVLGMTTGNSEGGSDHNSLYALFTICMSLTQEGLEHLNLVIETVFSYLNMLKRLGPVERIYNEIKAIEDISFRFPIEAEPIVTVEGLVENMHLYPTEDYITGSELYYEYDPQAISEVLDNLSPRKMNVMVLTRKVIRNIEFNKKEKWFGTPYTDIAIEEEVLRSWEAAEPLPQFSIPPPNKYLAQNFTILPEIPDNPPYPTQIHKTELMEIWYRKDQIFKLPCAFYHFVLVNPIIFQSTLNMVMLDLFESLLQMQLVEEAYPAQVAELNYVIERNDIGLAIEVNGYNEKLPVLIELITKHLTTFSTIVTDKVFNAIKDKVFRNYYNILLRPGVMAKDLRLKILIDGYYTVVDKYKTKSEVTVEKLRTFSSLFLKNMYIKALVQGNVSKDEALRVVSNFASTINCDPIPTGTYPKFNIYEVPIGTYCCQVENLNKTDTNTIVFNYYQIGSFQYSLNVLIELITLIIQEPLFDTLRTKEQLGYCVECSLRETHGVLGFGIKLNTQATKFTPKYVDDRLVEFIKTFTVKLEDMTDGEFDEVKKDLIKKKQCADVLLRQEVVRNWLEISEDEYRFDRLELEIEAIKKVELEDLREFWRSVTGLTQARKLSIRVVGVKDPNPIEDGEDDKEIAYNFLSLGEDDWTSINNIQKFQADLKQFPHLKKM